MRAFYRFPAPLPAEGLPAAVVLHDDGVFVWVLAERDPDDRLVALGAQRLGARLAELTPADRDHVVAVPVERDGERLSVPPSVVRPTDTVLGPALPRTVFAGDAPEDYC